MMDSGLLWTLDTMVKDYLQAQQKRQKKVTTEAVGQPFEGQNATEIAHEEP